MGLLIRVFSLQKFDPWNNYEINIEKTITQFQPWFFMLFPFFMLYDWSSVFAKSSPQDGAKTLFNLFYWRNLY